MALKKIRFVWSAPALPEGRWRLGLFALQTIPDPARPSSLPSGALPAYWKKYLHHALHVNVRGLLVWGALAAIVAYFAGAALLLRRLENANPRNRVAYVDLINPARWSELDRLRGEGLVLRGRDLLREGDFAGAFGLLRVGLAKNPGDHDARLEVARLYAALRLRSQAEKLLLDGLALGYPGRAYLELAFSLAADADRPDDWVALTLLARERFDASSAVNRDDAEARWLDQHTVKALRADDRSQEAFALVTRRYPETHPFRREVSILYHLDVGRPSEAVALAEAWSVAAPKSPEPLRLLVRALRESKDFVAMDGALVRLRALDPTRPDALLYAVVQNHLAGRLDSARASLDELLFRHGAEAGIYAAAAAVLVELRDSAGLDRLETEMRERGLSPRPILQARLQLAVAGRDWPEVLRRAEALRAARGPAAVDTPAIWLETVTRLAHACLDGASGTQASLVEVVSDHPGTLRLYKLLLEALLGAGRPATARQILTLAEGPYQNARAVAALRTGIETAFAAAVPPAAVVPIAAPSDSRDAAELASFEMFSTAFENRINAKDTPGALALLAETRRARPGWLAAAESRLDALELPLRARGDDPLRLQLLVRGALARDPDAPARLLALARELHDESPALRANALLLLKEIVRRADNHSEALVQLAAWEPRVAAAPLDIAP